MSFYKHLSTLVMAGLLAFTSYVHAEEEFSISITGPDDMEAAPARPAPRPVVRPAAPVQPQPVARAPAAPAMQTPAQQPAGMNVIPTTPAEQINAAAQEIRPANLPANFQAQHTVGPRETIWSIAHRYSAPHNNVNEFQAVASIYRNNRDAFEGGNVNNIRRGTTINIPVAQEMALEQTQTGSDLLSNGTTTLPPLNRGGLNAQGQGQLAGNTPAGPVGAVNARTPIGMQAQDLTGAAPSAMPVFTARETMLRDVNPNLIPEAGTHDIDKEVITDEQLQAENAKKTDEKVPELAKSSLDLQAIENLLDKTERNIQTAQKDIYRRLDDNIQRSAQVAKDTATVTAKEEVGELINHYEQVIAELQQSNTDLKSSLSKINKQVEQIRGFQMETADSVATLDRRIEDQAMPIGTPAVGGTNNFESGPVMWVLLIVGVLALLMSIGLFIFKSRMRRQRAMDNSYDDDGGDFMDEDDMEISSLLASAPVAEMHDEPPRKKQAPAKQEVVEDSGHMDDGPMDDMGMEDDFDGGYDGDLDSFGQDGPSSKKPGENPDFHDEIVMPSAAPLNTAGKAAVAGAAAAGAAMGAAAVAASHEDEAQAAWDSAATNASSALDLSLIHI